MNGKKRHKITAIVAVVMLFAVAIMAIPFVPDGTMRARAASGGINLSNYTLEYNWSAGSAPTTPLSISVTQVTINNQTVNSMDISFSYVNQGVEGKSCYISVYNETSGFKNREWRISAGYKPDIKTIHGYIYIPVQSGYPGEMNTKYFGVSLGSSAYIYIQLNDAEGENDEIILHNDTSYISAEIPRIPREQWNEFLISADIDVGVLNAYVYFGENIQKHLSINAGNVAYPFNYFTMKYMISGYKLSGKIYVDELGFYKETYTVTTDVTFPQHAPVYYKGWDWKNYVYVWDRNASLSDQDIDTNKPWYSIFTYLNKFETKKVVVWLNDSNYNAEINRTLKYDKLREIWFKGNMKNLDMLRAISWNAVFDKRIKAFQCSDYSSLVEEGYFTYSDVVNATNALNTYAHVDLVAPLYPSNYQSVNMTMMQLPDAYGVAWGPRDDLSKNVPNLITYLRDAYPDKPLYLYWYPHDWPHHDGQPDGVSEWFFRFAHDEIVKGDIKGVICLGVVRYMNYNNNEYPHTKEAIRFFINEMALSYSEDGSFIKVSKEEDLINMPTDTLLVPLLNDSAKKLTVNSSWDVQLEVQIPPTWSYDTIVVKDKNGTAVDWREGSVIFNATAGHEYMIYDNTPSGGFWLTEQMKSLTWYQWAWILIAVIIIMAGVAIYASPKINILPSKKKED